jgi:hypothetical protein
LKDNCGSFHLGLSMVEAGRRIVGKQARLPFELLSEYIPSAQILSFVNWFLARKAVSIQTADRHDMIKQSETNPYICTVKYIEIVYLKRIQLAGSQRLSQGGFISYLQTGGGWRSDDCGNQCPSNCRSRRMPERLLEQVHRSVTDLGL